MFTVGRTNKLTLCRTCRIHNSFKFERAYDVLALRICVFVKVFQRNWSEARRNDDCAVFFFYNFVLLFKIDCACGAVHLTKSAFARFEFYTLRTVNNRNVRDSLCERNIDCASFIKVHIKFACAFSRRTLLRTDTAACAEVFFNGSCFLSDFNVKVSDKAVNFFNLAVGVKRDIFVLSRVNHFRS